MKLCIVTSPGGHLKKTLLLKEWWSSHERFWVTRDDQLTKKLLKDEVIIPGFFPENRNIVNFFRNTLLAWNVLTKQKPDMIFSTGAGISVPFFILGCLLGTKNIFIETFITIPHKTISGQINYFFTHIFLVQNKKLLHKYGHKARYLGPIISF